MAIYFVQADGGPVKIGFASNVQNRLKALQTACPVTLRLIRVLPGGRWRLLPDPERWGVITATSAPGGTLRVGDVVARN